MNISWHFQFSPSKPIYVGAQILRHAGLFFERVNGIIYPRDSLICPVSSSILTSEKSPLFAISSSNYYRH